MSFNYLEAQREKVAERINLLRLGVGFAFAALILSFAILQIVQHRSWNIFAEEKQIRKSRVLPMRGSIYDRNGNLLAWSEPGYDVTVTPADVTPEALQRLAEILELPRETLQERINRNRSWSPFIPALVEENLDPRDPKEKLWRILVNSVDLPGVEIEERPVRRYHEDAVLLSHLLGYLGEISREELEDQANRDCRPGDLVGKSGLEKTLETLLRGKFGIEYKLQDARGREVKPEAVSDYLVSLEYREKIEAIKAMSVPMEPGRSALLTIDLRLQRLAAYHLRRQQQESQMEHLRASVVVMNIKTGEILCLLSLPHYDPSAFVPRISAAAWKELQENPDRPLLNRVLQGRYPPASTFKLVVAAGALEEGLISPGTTFPCDSVFSLGSFKFLCWNKYGHGRVDLTQAIVQSCDVYFYRLANTFMDVYLMNKWASRFGLGKPVLAGLLPEDAGLIPSPEWKQRTRQKPWFPGETVMMAIGQGYMLITPMQAVLIPAAIANNGRLMQPQLIHHFLDVQGETASFFTPRIMVRNLLSPSTVKTLQQSMDGVVNDPRGTAYQSGRSPSLRIAGKTGTAETGRRKYRNVPIIQIPYSERDHAWFIGYAPADPAALAGDSPVVAIVVMIEHGGPGGQTAAPVAKRILEDYFALEEARADLPAEGREDLR